VYSFDELSEEAQQKAIESNRYYNTEYEDWYESVYMDFIEQAKKEGFYVENMYFSGFSSQGDGAMFEYSTNDKIFEDFIDNILIGKEHLSPMRKEWMRTQLYACAEGRHRGRYYHEGCCSHKIYWQLNGNVHYSTNLGQWLLAFQDDFEWFLRDRYNDLCHSLYKSLEAEYDHLTSDESIKEILIENNYEYDIQGNII
jgi:hypothetical protein